jgi:hypothetical protein
MYELNDILFLGGVGNSVYGDKAHIQLFTYLCMYLFLIYRCMNLFI